MKKIIFSPQIKFYYFENFPEAVLNFRRKKNFEVTALKYKKDDFSP